MGTANRPLIEKASAAKDIAADDQEKPRQGLSTSCVLEWNAVFRNPDSWDGKMTDTVQVPPSIALTRCPTGY